MGERLPPDAPHPGKRPVVINGPEVLQRRLGILWCLTPELLQKYTAIDNGASKGVWFKAGAMVFEFYGLNYMDPPVLVRAQSLLALLACQLVLMGAIEA